MMCVFWFIAIVDAEVETFLKAILKTASRRPEGELASRSSLYIFDGMLFSEGRRVRPPCEDTPSNPGC